MIEARHGGGFTLEASEPLRRGGGTFRQDLDRDVALETRVTRAVDLAHSACAERSDDLVPYWTEMVGKSKRERSK